MITPFSDIAKRYTIPLEDNPHRLAELSFAAIFTQLWNQAEAVEPSRFQELQQKKELVVVDVGSGWFHYGEILTTIFQEFHPHTRIFAVDKNKLKMSYGKATFLKGDIGQIGKDLKKQGISEIDFFTVLNPYPACPPLSP